MSRKENGAVIALQTNPPGRRRTETRHRTELALRHAGFEVIAAEHVLEILLAVDVVLAFGSD